MLITTPSCRRPPLTPSPRAPLHSLERWTQRFRSIVEEKTCLKVTANKSLWSQTKPCPGFKPDLGWPIARREAKRGLYGLLALA